MFRIHAEAGAGRRVPADEGRADRPVPGGPAAGPRGGPPR